MVEVVPTGVDIIILLSSWHSAVQSIDWGDSLEISMPAANMEQHRHEGSLLSVLIKCPTTPSRAVLFINILVALRTDCGVKVWGRQEGRGERGEGRGT